MKHRKIDTLEIQIVLKQNNYFAQSENIEFAKGKNNIPRTIKDSFHQYKRLKKWLIKK